MLPLQPGPPAIDDDGGGRIGGELADAPGQLGDGHVVGLRKMALLPRDGVADVDHERGRARGAGGGKVGRIGLVGELGGEEGGG